MEEITSTSTTKLYQSLLNRNNELINELKKVKNENSSYRQQIKILKQKELKINQITRSTQTFNKVK